MPFIQSQGWVKRWNLCFQFSLKTTLPHLIYRSRNSSEKKKKKKKKKHKTKQRKTTKKQQKTKQKKKKKKKQKKKKKKKNKKKTTTTTKKQQQKKNWHMGRENAKKNAFEHAQNVRVHIILHMRSLIRAFAPHLNVIQRMTK